MTALAVLSEKLFSWATDSQLIKKFQSGVWSGYCVRYLHQLADHPPTFVQPSPFTTIQKKFTVKSILAIRRLRPRSTIEAPFHAFFIEVLTSPFIHLTLRGFEEDNLPQQDGVGISTIHVWVPVTILRRAVPTMVSTFLASKNLSTCNDAEENIYNPVRHLSL